MLGEKKADSFRLSRNLRSLPAWQAGVRNDKLKQMDLTSGCAHLTFRDF
jgi:hypothetical protein